VTRRTATGRPPLAAVPAPVLVLGGVVGLEGGAAVAATLIPRAGIAGTVSLRLGFGALGLLALSRPRLRSLDRRTVLLVAVVGSVLAAHHLFFYEAIHRLPLGVAVTLEFVGPLTVALLGSQRRVDVLWAALAAIGVAGAAGIAAIGHINVAGVAFGLGAGACWAGYIAVFPVLAARAGRGDGLALSTAWAAAAIVPYAVVTGHGRIFTAHALLFGAVVALLSDVIAYTVQSEALGRIPRSLFSILTSTEPAVGAILGLTALGQHITAQQWAGMLAVVVASIGATRSHQTSPAAAPAAVSATSRPLVRGRMMNPLLIEVPSPLGLRATGLEGAPDALRAAGLHERLGSPEVVRIHVPPYSDVRDPATGVLNPHGIAAVAHDVAGAVGAALDGDRFPVLLGGDCSIMLGPLLALKRRGRYGLVFLDGHADFQHPDEEPNGEVASLDLALATGRGPAALADLDGLRPLVRDEDVALVGYRVLGDNDHFLDEHVRSTAIKVVDLPELRDAGTGRVLAEVLAAVTKPELEGFWVHLDVDVLDDALMPAVDYRHPGGMSWEEAAKVLSGLLTSDRARGLEVTIFNPRLDPDGSIARNLADLIVTSVQAATRR